MAKASAWLRAARLRTLPLSISGILVGTALASIEGYNNLAIFILALCPTIGFQITSNLANDYGDGVKGTDNDNRVGPTRALQSGALSPRELKKGIQLSSAINLVLVAILLYLAFGPDKIQYLLIFALLGILCIWAAVKYTVGVNAYGYRGLGDLFVFVFFGLVSVLGSQFLYGQSVYPAGFLPAMAIGFLSTAVLNLNNMRDLNSDRESGKITLAVRLGPSRSRIYHTFLIYAALICILVFNMLYARTPWPWIQLLAFVPLLVHLFRLRQISDPAGLDPELKKIALSTFLLSLLFYFTYYFL